MMAADGQDTPVGAGAVTAATPASGMPPPLRGEQRAPEVTVGVVQGDRACHACAFNLRGQPIVRESHYGMVMLRCSECGTVSPLAEYPLASGAARRLGAVMAIGWLLVVVIVYLIISIWAAGAAHTGRRGAVELVAMAIAERYVEYSKAEVAKQTAAGTPNMNTYVTWAASQPVSSGLWVDSSWWLAEAGKSWVDEARGLHRPFDRSLVPVWVRAWVLLLPAGMLLACMFPHARRPMLAVLALGVLPVGAGLLWLLGSGTNTWGGMGAWGRTAMDLAQEVVGFRASAIQLAMLSPSLLVGVWIGRPVARRLVVWLLPPRLRVAYAFLWLADGKPLPKPG